MNVTGFVKKTNGSLMKSRNKKSTKFQDFDLITFLEDYEIPYKEQVKNVGTGWVGLSECPFCGAGGYHFGVNIQSKGFSCWVCGENKGGLPRLISGILDIPRKEVSPIIKKYGAEILDFKLRETRERVILPSNIEPLKKHAKNYLNKRNFDNLIIKNYNLQETGTFSTLKIPETQIEQDFKFRIFIPIIMNGELVSFTTRDYTEEQSPKYKHPVLEAVRIPPSSCLYNIDSVKKRAVILEGPTDVWRMGQATTSIQGKILTKEQIRMLAEKRLERLVILFDENAEEQASAAARQLSGLADDIRIAQLDHGDPGELSTVEAIRTKRELLYW